MTLETPMMCSPRHVIQNEIFPSTWLRYTLQFTKYVPLTSSIDYQRTFVVVNVIYHVHLHPGKKFRRNSINAPRRATTAYRNEFSSPDMSVMTSKYPHPFECGWHCRHVAICSLEYYAARPVGPRCRLITCYLIAPPSPLLRSWITIPHHGCSRGLGASHWLLPRVFRVLFTIPASS